MVIDTFRNYVINPARPFADDEARFPGLQICRMGITPEIPIKKKRCNRPYLHGYNPNTYP
jgi:hypothetical protein